MKPQVILPEIQQLLDTLNLLTLFQIKIKKTAKTTFMRCNEWTTENTDYNYVLRKYIAMQKFLRIGKNISIVSSSSTRTWMILSVLQFAKLRKINNKLMISFLKNICKDLEMINNFWLIFKLRTSFIQFLVIWSLREE